MRTTVGEALDADFDVSASFLHNNRFDILLVPDTFFYENHRVISEVIFHFGCGVFKGQQFEYSHPPNIENIEIKSVDVIEGYIENNHWMYLLFTCDREDLAVFYNPAWESVSIFGHAEIVSRLRASLKIDERKLFRAEIFVRTSRERQVAEEALQSYLGKYDLAQFWSRRKKEALIRGDYEALPDLVSRPKKDRS